MLVTMYGGSFEGGPLFCSTPSEPLFFSTDTQPWIALPIEDFTSGKVMCGDLYYLRFENGQTLMARALDAGPFAMYCVRQVDGSCPSIRMDVPVYFWPVDGISAWVEAYPISQWAREWGMRD